MHTRPVNASLDVLKTHKLVYLGTPYTKYHLGLECAFVDAARTAAELLKADVKVYSPIAHTHPLAMYGNIDPRNHDIWLPFDRAMMDAADAMVVAELEGWRHSYGIQHEIEVFTAAGKPIYRLDPKTMELRDHVIIGGL